MIECLNFKQIKSYEILTAAEDQLKGIIELRGDGFFCDETSLLEFFLCN